MRKPIMGFLNRSNTNWSVPSQKMARSLKLGFIKYRVSLTICEAKTKALISFAVTDLRLCFHICRLLVFSRCGSYNLLNIVLCFITIL